ncbi:MAG: sugar transferase, partial [Bacteroidota bacterium]|nr:sugar transferase [Bacteroidota bacterium]
MTETNKNKVLNILYIGGDTDTIELLNSNLQLSIKTKPNSLLAVNYFSEQKEDIDAILCEQHIPGLNGIETYKLLCKKKITPKIPFLLVTHEFEPKVLQESVKNKIDDVYLTPLNPEKIVQRVNFLLDFKKFQQKKSQQDTRIKEYKMPFHKRSFDILVSFFALLFLSPILLIITIAIRIESKGRVYYTSKRVGTGYKIFDFYKLRSMYTGADQQLKNLEHLNQYGNGSQESSKTDTLEDELTMECPRCKELGSPCSPILFIGGKEIC